MKPRANIALLLLSLLLPCAAASAQELQASVRVLTDALPPEHRYDVATLEQDLQLYLTTQRFGDAPWEHLPIPTELTVILTGRSGSLYSARLVLQMAVPLPNGPSPVLQLTDDQWSFGYSRGAFLSYQPLRYDPLLSLIDFYVLLGIGLVADSYTEHGGTGILSDRMPDWATCSRSAGSGIRAVRQSWGVLPHAPLHRASRPLVPAPAQLPVALPQRCA
jgi:hypothetical protein